MATCGRICRAGLWSDGTVGWIIMSQSPTHRKFYNETEVIKSMPEKRIVLTIDPNELKEGVCKVYSSKDENFAVCLEDEKIKIFPIEE